MHYYQFNIADYQTHTKHLTPIEDICFRRLLDWQYMHEKPISTDINSVCRLLILRDYLTDVEQVLNEFFILTDEGWVNSRAFDEIEQYRDKSKKASEAGKASAAKRSLRTESTNNQQYSNEKEHTFNDCSTDVQPTINYQLLTTNQLKPIDTNVSIVRNEIQIPDQDDIVNQNIPDCPHKEIISLYAKHLPMGIQPREWDGARAATLKARWREKKKRQDLGWWDGFFKHASESKFLTGQVSTKDRAAFEITLPWMLKSENFKKIIEGVYHR